MALITNNLSARFESGGLKQCDQHFLSLTHAVLSNTKISIIQ